MENMEIPLLNIKSEISDDVDKKRDLMSHVSDDPVSGFLPESYEEPAKSSTSSEVITVKPDLTFIDGPPEDMIVMSTLPILKSDSISPEQSIDDDEVLLPDSREMSRTEQKETIGKNFICVICSKVYSTNRSLKRHMKSHPVSFEPSVDDNESSVPDSREMSCTEQKQPISRHFICVICSKAYSNNRNLTRHMKLHLVSHEQSIDDESSVPDSKEMSRTEQKQTGKYFLCVICSKGYSIKRCYRRHMKLHEKKREVSPSLVQMGHSGNINSLKTPNGQVVVEELEGHPKSPVFVEVDPPCSVNDSDSLIINSDPLNTLDSKETVMVKSELSFMDAEKGQRQSELSKSEGSNCGEPLEEMDTSITSDGNVSNASVEQAMENFTCFICRMTFDKSHLNSHMNFHSGNGYFDCVICGKRFLESSELQIHVDNDHSSYIELEKKFKCALCDKKFGRKSHLTRHLKVHDPSSYNIELEKKFECSFCYKKFGCNSHLNRHMKLHVGGKTYDCGVCGKSFLQNSNLKAHEGTHVDDGLNEKDEMREYVCEICGKRFDTNAKLRGHINRAHSSVRTDGYECCVCNKTFGCKRNLKRHMKLHERDENYDCKVCGKSFVQNIDLKVHEKTHLDAELYKTDTDMGHYDCEICGKRFNESVELQSHVNNIHSSVPEDAYECSEKSHVDAELYKSDINMGHYDCEICGKRFNESVELQSHVNNIHSSVPEDAYECSVCNKTFVRNSHMKRHMKLHGGGVTYDCNVCGKSFSQNSNLKLHEKSHADEMASIEGGLIKRHVNEETKEEYYECEQCGKTYPLISSMKAHISTVHAEAKLLEKCHECTYCGKQFGRSSHLKRHLKLHIGGEIYPCEICGKSFNQHGNMKAHMQMVHKEK